MFVIADQEELIIGKIRFKTFDLGGHETGKLINTSTYSKYNNFQITCCCYPPELILSRDF